MTLPLHTLTSMASIYNSANLNVGWDSCKISMLTLQTKKPHKLPINLNFSGVFRFWAILSRKIPEVLTSGIFRVPFTFYIISCYPALNLDEPVFIVTHLHYRHCTYDRFYCFITVILRRAIVIFYCDMTVIFRCNFQTDLYFYRCNFQQFTSWSPPPYTNIPWLLTSLPPHRCHQQYSYHTSNIYRARATLQFRGRWLDCNEQPLFSRPAAQSYKPAPKKYAPWRSTSFGHTTPIDCRHSVYPPPLMIA